MPSKIEKEFVDNLQNFTESLENLVELLKIQNKKGGSGVNDMASGMDNTKMKNIADDLKALVKVTNKIDSRTKEILAEVRQHRKSKEGGIFQKTSDNENKKKVVDGVKLIVLISLGVLAIGMAFKLVGFVNPLTVISLSFAIIAIAMVFEKLSKIKDLNAKKASLIGGVLIILSFAIMASSHFLRWTAPISLITAFSIVMVGATIGIAAWFLLKAFHKIDITKPNTLKSLLLMPLILPIIALSIVLSSFILTLTKPITLEQGLTALGIGVILGVATYLLLKGLNGQDLSKPQTIKSILLLPLLLPLIAASIVLSSYFLKLTQKVTLEQSLTALAVGAVIGVAAYLLLKAVQGQDLSNPQTIKSILLLPLLLPAIALSIAASSLVFKLFTPLKNPWKILESGFVIALLMIPVAGMIYAINKLKISTGDIIKSTLSILLISTTLVLSSIVLQNFKEIKEPTKLFLGALAIGAAILVFTPIMFIISKFNISATDIVKASLTIILISIAMVASSYILSIGKYDKYPPLEWTLGAGLSILTFGLFAFGLSFVASNPLFYAGIAIVPLIALSIILTSAILGLGNFSKFPSLEWSVGVGLSLLAFVPAMLIAGVGIIGIALGAPAMLLIALTIVKVADILSKGNYSGGPSLSWALALGVLIPVFSTALVALGAIGILAGPALLVGSVMLLGIAKAIVETSKILAGGVYSGGPNKEWSEGVGISIGAFANALGTAMNSGKSISQMLFGGGVTPEQFVAFITTVSQGIVSAATLFKGVTEWTGGPSEEWSKGVGTAISAFAQALSAVNSTGGLFTDSMSGDEFKEFIITISEGIKSAASAFKGDASTYTGGPDEKWSQRIGTAISVFSNALSNVTQMDIKPAKFLSFVSGIADSIKYLADKFGESDFTKYPDNKWISSLANLSNIIVFIGKNIDEKKIDSLNRFSDAVKNLSYSFSDLSQSGIDKISTLTNSLSILSVVDTSRLDSVVRSLDVNKDLIKNAVTTINNSQQNTSGVFDSIKEAFKSILPKQSDQKKISYNKKESTHEGLKVDNKDITDRLDNIIKKMDNIVDLMTKGKTGGNLAEQDQA